ncbi:MAG TPA: HAMP domain-containing sensor histidine kinase [Acidimicrobiia bacterium]|nr:HAMP domain-containing sensor histidine kinase [Acidimicrobiia bacterium]
MSLRARLVAGMVVVSFVLVAVAFIIARTTEANLVDRVDQQLVSAGTIAQPIDGGAFGGPASSPTPPTTAGPTQIYVARIQDGDIRVLVQPNVTAEDAGAPQVSVGEALAAARTGDPFTVSSTTGSGRYRVLAVRVPGAVKVVGLSLQDVDATMGRLRLVLIAAIAIVVGILGVVVFWVLRLGVRPLKRMTKTAGAIAGGDLSQRVPAEPEGTEARELGDALNAMLTTIEGAFAERAATEARLRRFVADASHELRTPVTTIRGYAELYRHGGLAQPVELEQAMRRTEQESVRMASLVDDLLLLARLDEGRPLARDAVDLGVLGIDAAADARAVAPDRVITADVAAGVTVEGDEDRLRQVVGNLVANALVHTPAGTPVSVTVHNGGTRAVVEVRDEGPGMTADVAERAFERFSRADVSRSRHAGGSGLGLAIVRAIVVSHGGEVALESAPGAGTTVRVELPELAADSR